MAPTRSGLSALKKITPISEKWRGAIENRINRERELTIAAVGRGARLEPGCFWNLAGSFLFAVYVMTALGFGAPVPQTLFGRTAAISYAILAVPTHIYLMVNLSTCIVSQVDATIVKLRDDDPVSTTNSQQSCFSKKRSCCRTKLKRFFNFILIGHGIPLASVLYYTLGAVVFGVLRGNDAVNTVMYPLDFTTSGGLENIPGYIRFLYGIFVEGAMVLMACGLASLRRCSSGTIGHAATKYRLFTREECAQCAAAPDQTCLVENRV